MKQQGEFKVITISTGDSEKRIFVANANCLTLGRSNIVVKHYFHSAKVRIYIGFKIKPEDFHKA